MHFSGNSSILECLFDGEREREYAACIFISNAFNGKQLVSDDSMDVIWQALLLQTPLLF